MKQRLPKLARRTIVFLLLGAIVNIAVAWGCGLLIHSRHPLDNQGRFMRLSRTSGITRAYIGTGRMIIHQYGRGMNVDFVDFPQQLSESQFRKIIPSGSAFFSDEPALRRRLIFYREVLAGWPTYALRGELSNQHDSLSPTARGLFRFPYQDQSPGVWNELPLIPIWPGFAINTVFYAAIVWLLFFTPGTLRRRRRIKRGLCLACAYPIGVSPVCTECGVPVRKGGKREIAI